MEEEVRTARTRSVYDYKTMHRMADNKDIDIVYVVTPNALHLEHALAAAAAGKHVFCEKPLEISVERCQQMVDAVRKAGKLLGVAYRCQFEPNNLECVRLAREKVLGDVKIIDANFGFAMGDPTQWRLKRDLAGGGALMDVGIYCLQTTRMLTGEDPIWINAAEVKTDAVKFREVDETIMWQTKFPSGVVANCVSTYSANGLQGFRAATTRGWFGLDPAYYYGGIRGRRSDNTEINIPSGDQFALELDDFADCIINKKPTRVPGEMGVQDVKYLTAIYESIRKGRPISLAKMGDPPPPVAGRTRDPVPWNRSRGHRRAAAAAARGAVRRFVADARRRHRQRHPGQAREHLPG